MFGKLMKYELRDCMRVFLPLWGAVVAIAAVNGFTMGVDSIHLSPILEFIVHALPILLLVGLSFGMFIVAFVLIIRRFYTGLLGDDGYLAFTLPVTPAEHIFSKLLTALIMGLGCLVAGGLASLLMLTIRGYGNEVREFFAHLPGWLSSVPNSWLLTTEAIIFILLGTVFSILRLYGGMAFGHLFGSHRAAWSVVGVLLIGWIFTAAPIALARLYSRLAGGISFQITIETAEELLYWLPRFLGVGIGLMLVGCALLWLFTHFVLRKKLNIL